MTVFRNPPRGFRNSPFDLAFLCLGVVAVVLTKGLPGDPSSLIAIVVGHFFLFCNVVRLRRSFELAWAGVFVTLAVIGWGLGIQSWLIPPGSVSRRQSHTPEERLPLPSAPTALRPRN